MSKNVDAPILDIKIGPRIPRDSGNLQALADSVQERGPLQPIVVTPYMMPIAGARRLAAAGDSSAGPPSRRASPISTTSWGAEA